MPPKLTEGELYIMGDRDFRTGEPGPYVKIGIVRNEKESSARQSQHQTGNPREIVILATAKSPMVESLETHLHHHFAERWVHGEWFDMDEAFVHKEVMPLVATLIAEQEEDRPMFEAQESLKGKVSSGNSRAPTPQEQALHAAFCDAKRLADRLEADQTVLKQHILDAMAGAGGVQGIVTVQVKTNAGTFDKAGLLAAHPTETAPYMVTKPAKTEVKGSLTPKNTPTLKSEDEALHAASSAAKKAVKAITVAQGQSKEGPRTTALLALHATYVAGAGPLFKANLTVDRLKAHLAHALGDDDEIEGVISWKRVEKTTPETVDLDKASFAKAHPDLVAAFTGPETQSTAFKMSECRPYPI
jgi:hypothetical protein